METEAETGGTRPPAREHLEPPELEEAGRPLPGACGGSRALGPLDLRRPVSEEEFLPFLTSILSNSLGPVRPIMPINVSIRVFSHRR